jgi:N-acetylmuramoyl-L-alanine amidase
MFAALHLEARLCAAVWRQRLAYGLRGGQHGLAFLAMLGVPLLGVLGIVYFAYVDGTHIEPVGMQAAQRAARRTLQREDDLQCLAQNVYFEARGEPLAGQYAVAEVTLNRTRAQHFPHSICQVVHETRWDPGRRRQVADFSWVELGVLTPQDGPAWRQAQRVASATYDDLHEPLVPGALFYHATNVRPAWSRGRTPLATIGNHIFYR